MTSDQRNRDQARQYYQDRKNDPEFKAMRLKRANEHRLKLWNDEEYRQERRDANARYREKQRLKKQQAPVINDLVEPWFTVTNEQTTPPNSLDTGPAEL